MKSFNNLPKTIKKTVRYINQDIQSFDKLADIEKILMESITLKKDQLQNSTNEMNEDTYQDKLAK